MRFFAASFVMQLKRLVRRRAALACLLLAPMLTLALGWALPADAAGDPVRVGVLMPEADSPAAGRVWQSLLEYSDAEIAFEPADSREEMEARVGAGAWECGYILPEDLDERLARGSTVRLVTRVDSPSTTLSSTLDWMVAASLLDVYASDIALSQLEAAMGSPAGDPGAQGNLRRAADAAFAADGLMELEVVPVGGWGHDYSRQPGEAGVEPAASEREAGAATGGGVNALSGASLVRGMVALLLFLYSCLCAAGLAGDTQTGFFARLAPYAGPARLYFPAWAACGALGAVAGTGCLAIAAAFFPGRFLHPLREIGLLALYLVYLAAFSFLLASIFRKQNALLCLLPFLLVACLLFCPILIDLSLYIPAGKTVAALLPPTLYLRAAAGQIGAVWSLLGGSVVLFIGGRLFSVAKRASRWYTH